MSDVDWDRNEILISKLYGRVVAFEDALIAILRTLPAPDAVANTMRTIEIQTAAAVQKADEMPAPFYEGYRGLVHRGSGCLA